MREFKGQTMNRQITAVLMFVFLVGAAACNAAAADAAPAPAPAPTGATTDWGALPPNELAELARGLVGDDEAVRLTRQRLAEHITTKYLADPAATKFVASGDWLCFSECLGEDLSDASRRTWAEKLFSAYSTDAATSTGVSAGAVVDVAKTLYVLGAEAEGATLVEQSIPARTWTADELAAAAETLSGFQDAGKTARLALAKYMSDNYLADPAVVRSVGPRTWKTLTSSLRTDLSAEVKMQWAAGLQGAFGVGAVESMKSADVMALGDALNSLEVKDAYAILLPHIEKSSDWQSLKASDLALLARAISTTGDAGKTARLLLAKHVADKYLADATSTRSVTAGDWMKLIDSLRKDLAAETRAEWSGKLRSAFVDDAAVLGTLELWDAKVLAAALDGLGDKQAFGVVPVWMTATTAWQSLKPTEVASLAWSLARSGDAGKAARQRLAEHITTKYLADAASTKSISSKDWRKITAWGLGVELTEEGRKTWAEKILSAYTGAGGSVAGLQVTEVGDLVEAAIRLGAVDQGTSLVQQRLASVAWKPDELVSLAGVLSGLGDSGKSARSQLAMQLADKYLASPGAVRAVTCRQWSSLVVGLRRDLSGAMRVLWASKLREAFDANTLATLKFDEAWDLGGALSGLGSSSAYDVLLPGLAKSTEWLSLDPPRLADLAGRLADLGDRAEQPQSILARHVVATFLSSREKIKSINLGSWKGLARVSNRLPDEARQAWAKGLKDAFVPDDNALLQMPAGDVKALAGALAPLDEKLADDLTYTWYTGRETGGGLKWGKDLIAAAQMAVSGGRRTQAERDAIVTSLEKALAAAPTKPEEQFDLAGQMLRLWSLAGGNSGKMKEWGTKAYESVLGTEEARNGVSMERLGQLAVLLNDYKLSGKGKAFPGFVQALARHARQGTLKWGRGVAIASFLTAPESRQALQDELLDAQGSPRLPVAKVLTWAYRGAGELGQWRAFLQTSISSSNGDTKALWLAADAYAAALVPNPPDPLRRRRGLNGALAAAVSDPVRLIVLREFVDFYRAIGRPGQAAEMFESVKHQLGEAAAKALEQMQVELRLQEEDRQAQAARTQAAVEITQKESQLRYYRARLERARAAGDAGEAARLQAAIQQLERDLAK